MVKIGFICEGQTEAELVSSNNFNSYLNSIGLEFINALNAKGSGNLLSYNIKPYIQALERLRAQKIIILTNLDEDKCITITKQRMNARPQDIVIVAIKEIEAWFLANTPAMSIMLGNDNFYFEFPEKEMRPFETINQLLIKHTTRGIGKKSAGKITLVRNLLNIGFDVRQSAAHPNCPSAAYFLKKLNELT